MDYLVFLAPEALRQLSTALIVKAAARECGATACSPSLSCSAPITPEARGYSGYTVLITFIVGLCIGHSANYVIKTYWIRSPSAATIALRKIA